MFANENAPVRAAAEVEIGAPPQVVLEVLTRFENWPNWNPEVKSMSLPGPLAPGTEFRWKSGPGTIVSTLERVEAPHSFDVGRRDFAESFSGLLARLLRRTLQKTLDKSLEDGLERLKREAERRSA